MPDEFVRWGETWAKLHPGWAMKLWTEENLPASRFPSHLERACHLAQRANIYRYELLLREGGVYVDTDFECLRNIEELVDDCGFFAAYQTEDSVNNAFIGSEPGHPVARLLTEGIPEMAPERSRSLGANYLTPRVMGRSDVKLFPREMFYPYKWNELDRRGEVFPDAYAVHHWSSKWHGASFKLFSSCA